MVLSHRGQGASGRISVRGAFGPNGSLGLSRLAARRNSATAPSRAQLFQLDRCLDKKALDKVIYQMQTSSDVAAQLKMGGTKSSSEHMYEYNVDGFAKYLAQNKALATLLFWKDTEEYSGLFGDDERKAVAEKIFYRYLERGAEYEVTSLGEEVRLKIKDELKHPTDELFAELQSEAYSIMLFELFPRFYEECKRDADATDGSSKKTHSEIKSGTTLKDILQPNSFEVHLFAEYCKDQFCEDQVIFLLEVIDYRLLFSPNDKRDQAKRIYSTYLDPSSEARIVSSESEFRRVKGIYDEMLEKSTDPPAELFDKLSDDVQGTLAMDVWPRYKEAVLSGEDLKKSALAGSGAGLEDLVDMNRPSKKAVAAILKIPSKLEHLRTAAAAQGVKENVDFCVECQAYRLLFSDVDRKPRAQIIWKTFLMPGADTPVNISDSIIRKIETRVEEAPSELFEIAYNEVLQIVSDNIFSHYMRAIEKEQEAAKAAPSSAATPPKAAGGCCLLM